MATYQNLLDRAWLEAFDANVSATYQTKDIRDPDIYIGREPPVDIIQFIEDPYYIGGQVKLQPNVKQLLWDLEDPSIREANVEVGKGSGKSEISSIATIYGAYCVTRMVDPQGFFNLAKSTIVASVNVSISKDQARDVVFQAIKGKVVESPYFQSLNPVIGTVWVRLPNNIRLYCGHSGDKAFLGYGTIRGVMDEVNYMFDSSHRNVAENLYNMLIGSMTTRFPKHYKIVACSSTTLPNTWLRDRITQAQKEGTSYMSRARILDVQTVAKDPKTGIETLTVVVDQTVEREALETSLAQKYNRRLVGMNDVSADGKVVYKVTTKPQMLEGL